MTVRIVTDGTSDIPLRLLNDLGITEVPIYVTFGDKSYRNRIDITEDEFYSKLLSKTLFPTTSQPTPQDFAEVYDKIGEDCDGIISIHISPKLSGTINSAEQAKKMVTTSCPIEIIDSETMSMPLGLLVLAAARLAQKGKSMTEITGAVRNMIPNIKLLALFDTLEYLARGGRIGKAKMLLGSMLNVKPLLTTKDGEFVPVSQVRNHKKGREKLLEFVNNVKNIAEATVVYSTTPDEAQELAGQITSVPGENIIIARLGPVIGTHAGPGLLAIAYRLKS
jgi:DegV family protein with EDD domain